MLTFLHSPLWAVSATFKTNSPLLGAAWVVRTLVMPLCATFPCWPAAGKAGCDSPIFSGIGFSPSALQHTESSEKCQIIFPWMRRSQYAWGYSARVRATVCYQGALLAVASWSYYAHQRWEIGFFWEEQRSIVSKPVLHDGAMPTIR